MVSVPVVEMGCQPRILGAGWDAGCPDPPELWGVERADMILNLTDSSNVVIACMELTDHVGCVEDHTGGLACERETYPYGPWAADSLHAEDSANVYLQEMVSPDSGLARSNP